MKQFITKNFAVLIAVAAWGWPAVSAQAQSVENKGPTGILYLAESSGRNRIIADGKSIDPAQATSFDAPGASIETMQDAHQALVYSNGTGLYLDQNTRLKVDQFSQEDYTPLQSHSEVEPSASRSSLFMARGQIGICTGQMVSGSKMSYRTPHAQVNIRGGRVALSASDDATTVYLLEGDATLNPGGNGEGGILLRPGEMARIVPGLPGQPPQITVSPIDANSLPSLDAMVGIACNAKKTVSFDTTTAGGTTATTKQVARPTVTASPPTYITVSPDRLNPPPSGG